jgi:hypothetical protein
MDCLGYLFYLDYLDYQDYLNYLFYLGRLVYLGYIYLCTSYLARLFDLDFCNVGIFTIWTICLDHLYYLA